MELLADRVESLCGYKPDPDIVANFLRSHVVTGGGMPARQTMRQAPAPMPVRQNPQGQFGFVLLGRSYAARSARDVLIKAFQALAKREPSFLERFAVLLRHPYPRVRQTALTRTALRRAGFALRLTRIDTIVKIRGLLAPIV